MDGMTIMLRRNPNTGKQDMIVKIDSNVPPIEYERLHRKLVDKLVSQEFKPDDFGELIVEHGV
jgi:hypothetical protein